MRSEVKMLSTLKKRTGFDLRGGGRKAMLLKA